MQRAAFWSLAFAKRILGVRERELITALRQMALVGLIVFGLAMINLTLTRREGEAPAIWAASAFLVVCLARSPRRRWPSLLAAGAVGHLIALMLNIRPAAVLAAVVADALEVTVCAAGLRALCGRRLDLSRPRTLLAFGAMAVIGPLISGVLVSALLGKRLDASGLHQLTVWLSAHGLGLIVVAPVLLAIRPRVLKRLAARPSDIVLLIGFTAALLVLFSQSLFPPQAAVIALIVLVTFRLEQTGAALAALITALVAMGFMLTASSRAGVVGDLAGPLLSKQISLAIMTTCALTIGATLAQRRRLKISLKMSLAAAEAARLKAVEAARQAMMAEQVAGIGFWRLDVSSDQVVWSAEMYRMWDFDVSESPNLAASLEAVHPDDRERAEADLRRGLETHEAFHSRPIRLLRRDGRVRHLAGRISNERDAGGAVTTVHGAMVDITHLQLADEALRSSESRYRLLADHSSDIIVRVDMDNTMLYVSPSCRRLGYEPDELIGRSRFDLLHPDDAAGLIAGRAAVLTGPASPRAHLEFRVRAKDGRWVWFEGSPSIIRDEAGAAIELVSQLRDITEHKAFEAELLAARDAADAAAKAKAEFLANMSHEIRTPLTSIIGFSGLLAQAGDLPEQAGRYVQRIATAGQSLLSVVNDILDFSKLEAGQVELDPHPFDPANFVEDTVELLSTQAENKGLTLGLIIDDSVPERVEADSSRLRQLLLNLIGNAIKFTVEGRVTVAMTYVQGRLRIQVADTGPGIPAERRDRLFQRFSQVDGSVNRHHGGTGLGLAICKSLVKLMDGDIGVDSEEGKGSVFWFTLAAPAAGEGAHEAEAECYAESRACRILVVDDVSVNRELVRTMLEPFGHSFVEAGSGGEAVAIALSQPFDLILMDLQMPGMDGLTATRAIRAESDVNGLTPILALSANVMAGHLAACADAGMDDHIGKPIQPMRLMSKVAEWSRLRHAPSAEDRKRA